MPLNTSYPGSMPAPLTPSPQDMMKVVPDIQGERNLPRLGWALRALARAMQPNSLRRPILTHIGHMNSTLSETCTCCASVWLGVVSYPETAIKVIEVLGIQHPSIHFTNTSNYCCSEQSYSSSSLHPSPGTYQYVETPCAPAFVHATTKHHANHF